MPRPVTGIIFEEINQGFSGLFLKSVLSFCCGWCLIYKYMTGFKNGTILPVAEADYRCFHFPSPSSVWKVPEIEITALICMEQSAGSPEEVCACANFWVNLEMHRMLWK